MIDIVVEPLLYADQPPVLAFADLGHDAPGSRIHDLCQHTVLDAQRAFILQEGDLVASGKMTDTIFRLEGVTVIDKAALDQLGARQGIEHPHVAAKVCEDQRGMGRIVMITRGGISL